jgi:hypothetical protein
VKKWRQLEQINFSHLPVPFTSYIQTHGADRNACWCSKENHECGPSHLRLRRRLRINRRQLYRQAQPRLPQPYAGHIYYIRYHAMFLKDSPGMAFFEEVDEDEGLLLLQRTDEATSTLKK